MDVPYALRITTSDRDRIAPAVEDVPGVQAEPHERRVGASHQLVDLSRSLNVCPGMRMERSDQADLLRAARDLVRDPREAMPLLLRETRVDIPYPPGDALALRISGFREHEDRRAERGKQPARVYRVRELLFIARRDVERDRTKCARERKPPFAQQRCQGRGVLGKVAPRPELGARVAQLRHLVQDALVGHHHTPIGELADTPADRRGAYLHRRSSHRSRTSTTSPRLYLGIRRDGDIRVNSEVLCPHRICEGAHHAVGRDELRAHIARATGYIERSVPCIADHDAGDRRGDIGEELEPRSRAVAHLDTDPASAAAVGLQIELGAARRFGHERPAETERLENRGDRPTVADVNPCRRSPERIGVTGSEIAPMQVMRVASTKYGVPLATTQEALPERQRSDVLLGPRAVPDLNRMKPRHTLVLPRRPEWFRVADAHDGTALRGCADRSLHGLGVRLTKFPPAIGAPRVPVPAICGDLDPGDDDRKTVAAWPVGELMADIVVVRHAEEVETCGARRIEHLDRPRVTVRIERVAMEVAADPAGSRGRQGHDVAHPGEVRILRRGDARVEPDLDLPIAAARAHLVRPEQHVPAARFDLALAVGRSGPGLVDGECHLLAAAPSAESRAAFGDSALVKEADVERVPATERRIGIDLIVVRVPDVNLPTTCRHIERHVRITTLVILSKVPMQNEVRLRELLRAQFRAAPLEASKTRTPSGRARKKTAVPGSGRTSGPVRTLRSTSPSFTFTMTSLPSGSETTTSAGCAPKASARSSSIASGRSPTLIPSLPATPRGASTRQPPVSTSASPSRLASTMFIGGLPMNCATKRFAGRW